MCAHVPRICAQEEYKLKIIELRHEQQLLQSKTRRLEEEVAQARHAEKRVKDELTALQRGRLA